MISPVLPGSLTGSCCQPDGAQALVAARLKECRRAPADRDVTVKGLINIGAARVAGRSDTTLKCGAQLDRRRFGRLVRLNRDIRPREIGLSRFGTAPDARLARIIDPNRFVKVAQ